MAVNIPLPDFRHSHSIIRSLSQDGTEKKLKIQEYGNELLNGLHRIQQKGKFCDVTLIVGDTKIPAHKIILSSFSSYFEALFNHGMQEENKNEVTLRNLNGVMVQKLVDFAYSGEIKFSDDNVQELLETANFLDIRLVSQKCAIHISKQIDSQNFIQVYELGMNIGEEVMTDAAFKYILDNFIMLSKTNEFNEIPFALFESILKQEKLKYVEVNKVPTCFNQEESILNVALSYIKSKKEIRLPLLPRVLGLVRIGLLLPSTLSALKENELVKESEESMQLIEKCLSEGPCYDMSVDTEIWRKPRKNDSKCINAFLFFIEGKVPNRTLTYSHCLMFILMLLKLRY